MTVYVIELTYTGALEMEFDDALEKLLGERVSSGFGFQMRDMRWETFFEPQSLLASIQKIVPADRLAYATLYAPSEVIFDYKAPWYTTRGAQ